MRNLKSRLEKLEQQQAQAAHRRVLYWNGYTPEERAAHEAAGPVLWIKMCRNDTAVSGDECEHQKQA